MVRLMARKISSDQPLRSAYDYCLNCPKGVDIKGVKDMSLSELNEARTVCIAGAKRHLQIRCHSHCNRGTD